MKLFILTLLGLALACSCQTGPEITEQDVELYFAQFKTNFNRLYRTGAEEYSRKAIFASNIRYILRHNWEYSNGRKHRFTMDVNDFADMTSSEFRGYYTSFGREAQDAAKRNEAMAANIRTSAGGRGDLVPDEVDWTKAGVVSPVKNQGSFGPSYVFATVGAIESAQAIMSGNLTQLSEQNLIDCCTIVGTNTSCTQITDGLNYVFVTHGIDTEKSYPYTGSPSACRFSPKNIGATITGYQYTSFNNETDLQDAVATVGPIAVLLSASPRSFQFYKSGVYDDTACLNAPLDHNMLVVGYGVESEDKFWKVKNSWGSAWGEKGYIRIARDANDMCSIASSPVYPTMHRDAQ